MAVRSMAASSFPELAREERIERDRKISGPEHNNLGAFRGFLFAMLIEASMALFVAVGWEVWKFIR
jgi:hypothetical protein